MRVAVGIQSAATMLKIWGYAQSINVRKVLWACEELGLAFEQDDWGGPGKPSSDPAFRTLNPTGLVPVIDDHGVRIWESNVILRYLAASRGRTDLLPAAPAERACVEQWMDWQASDFNNTWRVAFQGLVRKNPTFQNAAAIENSTNQLNDAVSVIDRHLGRTAAYMTGEQFTLADIVIGLSLHRWRSIPMPRPDYPHIERFYNLLLLRNGFVKYGRDGGP